AGIDQRAVARDAFDAEVAALVIAFDAGRIVAGRVGGRDEAEGDARPEGERWARTKQLPHLDGRARVTLRAGIFAALGAHLRARQRQPAEPDLGHPVGTEQEVAGARVLCQVVLRAERRRRDRQQDEQSRRREQAAAHGEGACAAEQVRCGSMLTPMPSCRTTWLSAAPSSSASRWRCSGDFCRFRATSSASSGGVSAAAGTRRTSGGAAWVILMSNATSWSAWNGSTPVRHSNSTVASA